MTKMLQKSDLILMLRKQVTLQWCDRNGGGTSGPLKVEVEAPTYYLATFSPSYARKWKKLDYKVCVPGAPHWIWQCETKVWCDDSNSNAVGTILWNFFGGFHGIPRLLLLDVNFYSNRPASMSLYPDRFHFQPPKSFPFWKCLTSSPVITCR